MTKQDAKQYFLNVVNNNLDDDLEFDGDTIDWRFSNLIRLYNKDWTEFNKLMIKALPDLSYRIDTTEYVIIFTGGTQ